MGYCSQVVIAVDSANIDQVRPLIEKIEPDYTYYSFGWHLFKWDCIKWFPYPEIIAIEEALQSLDQDSFRFVRAGEDYDDIEVLGDGDTPITIEVNLGDTPITFEVNLHVYVPIINPEYVLISDSGYWGRHGWVDTIDLATRFQKPTGWIPPGKNHRWINLANEAVVFIHKRQVDYLQKLLDRTEIDFRAEGIPEDATLITYTAKFNNGYEADIKVCSGQKNCFIDPVLFNEQGGEVSVLDTEDKLLGLYDFGNYKVELRQI